MKTPFFILGSPRSGTTLLRNLLRQHPQFVCPEETHIFRWAEPFASTDYTQVTLNAETLQHHRSLDGISEEENAELFNTSVNRKDYLMRYLQQFAGQCEATKGRFFDKTPQHAYGILLIKAFFPEAQFIHLIRNPLNVITSLMLGRQFAAQSLVGAFNFWLEPLLILKEFAKTNPNDIINVHYNQLTKEPLTVMRNLTDFLAEERISEHFDTAHIHTEQNLYKEHLTEEQISWIEDQLKAFDLYDLYLTLK